MLSNPLKPRGRNSRGRFDKGNRIGPGNPNAASVHKFQKALASAVTEKEVVALFRMVYDLAMDPETPVREKIQASELIFKRTAGKLPEQITIDGEVAHVHALQAAAQQDNAYIESLRNAELSPFRPLMLDCDHDGGMVPGEDAIEGT